MKNNTKNMILVALFSALTAIGAYLEIPTQPVPITLQVLFCMYAGVLLGSKLGALSQIVYVVLGLIGLPVFAGGAGGFSYVLNPSFGYLIGFILCSFITGLLTERIKKLKGIRGLISVFSSTLVGLAVLYLIGVAYLYMIFSVTTEMSINVEQALLWGFYPFILQDIIKCALVAFTALKVIPIIKKAGYIK